MLIEVRRGHWAPGTGGTVVKHHTGALQSSLQRPKVRTESEEALPSGQHTEDADTRETNGSCGRGIMSLRIVG